MRCSSEPAPPSRRQTVRWLVGRLESTLLHRNLHLTQGSEPILLLVMSEKCHQERIAGVRLPTVDANYRKFAQEAARSGQPYEEYLLALLDQELTQRDDTIPSLCRSKADVLTFSTVGGEERSHEH
jgi:hypothetical protein